MDVLKQTDTQRLGFLTGQSVIPSDFDRLADAEIEGIFEGKDEPGTSRLVNPHAF